MKSVILVFATSLTINLAIAQCPFEEYPAIKSVEYGKWRLSEKNENYNYWITIASWSIDSLPLKVQLLGNDTLANGKIRVSLGEKTIQQIPTNKNIFTRNFFETAKLFSADYNNDGLTDLKLVIPAHGCCGAYNYYTDVYYLLQKSDGKFQVNCFNDLFLYYEKKTDEIRTERDFDGDGRFEIITQEFQHVGSHNYWSYNLYHFEGYELVNANSVADYPIMTQILLSDECRITKRISRENMKKFAKKYPMEIRIYNK